MHLQEERGLLEGETHLDEIEEMVAEDGASRTQLLRILRLLCLQSLTGGGIRAGRYDGIRRAIVQTYGYRHLQSLANMERAGLLRRREMLAVELQSQWSTVRRALR
ncbi:hypothetical protein B484DRAFT_1431 [Ochromonadaceae sp. CCMP2298]|nr:hypothetical protein B484DRAFT_1431 [Ochromonadaceae sp. CCMP2298]